MCKFMANNAIEQKLITLQANYFENNHNILKIGIKNSGKILHSLTSKENSLLPVNINGLNIKQLIEIIEKVDNFVLLCPLSILGQSICFQYHPIFKESNISKELCDFIWENLEYFLRDTGKTPFIGTIMCCESLNNNCINSKNKKSIFKNPININELTINLDGQIIENLIINDIEIKSFKTEQEIKNYCDESKIYTLNLSDKYTKVKCLFDIIPENLEDQNIWFRIIINNEINKVCQKAC